MWTTKAPFLILLEQFGWSAKSSAHSLLLEGYYNRILQILLLFSLSQLYFYEIKGRCMTPIQNHKSVIYW